MASFSGRRVPISLPRRWIDDLMRASHGRPIVTFERRMNLAAVAAARKVAPISWPLLFAKAFAIVAVRRPELRRARMPFPWPHFYEAEITLTSMALEREYRGERAVFFGYLREPDKVPLQQLQTRLDAWRTAPVESITDFRRLIRYAKIPNPLRRLVWWYGANATGYVRARNFGTTGISITASTGSTALNLISPVTTTINYGPFDDDHTLDVRLHFDHRVLDGMIAAATLADMEATLLNEIVVELRSMVPPPKQG